MYAICVILHVYTGPLTLPLSPSLSPCTVYVEWSGCVTTEADMIYSVEADMIYFSHVAIENIFTFKFIYLCMAYTATNLDTHSLTRTPRTLLANYTSLTKTPTH